MPLKLWIIMGLIATTIIAVALPVYAWNEADRMARAQENLLVESIEQGQVIYAENCVVCHGAAGAGISAYPALANQGVRDMDYDTIFKVIQRGRYNTAMAPWGVNEGGVLNDMQIDQLIAMIQQGDWAATAQTVDNLGLNPPTVISVEIPEEILASLADLPHGEVMARALPLYAANCAGCHGGNGEGTAIAPARTFGFVRELPALQAQGLAKGVSLDNTLGLTDEGGYTAELRLPDEPLRHKVLDLIGDLMLCGVPITGIRAHIVARNAGHTSHMAFGKQLAQQMTQ